ncbi:MAG: DoxX family protein [Bacteroidetes bacterium]|nr:DoxX family protein [Bacteroidota bacterium]
MKKLLSTSSYPLLLCRLAVGLIFLSEGIQKFLRPEDIGSGRFAKIGFSSPDFWAHFAGSFEIVCGLMVLIGLFTRFAVIPLLIIMITAFITTKLPILSGKGFWPFAHEYRTDFALTLLLLLLLTYGGGRTSLDSRMMQNAAKLH